MRVSLRSLNQRSFNCVREAKSKPVNALSNPRSTISLTFSPPIVTCPSCSGKNTVRNQSIKSKSFASFGFSSSSIAPHAQPISPITALNMGSPAAPERINVVPNVPKNIFAASAFSFLFALANMRLKFLSRYNVT